MPIKILRICDVCGKETDITESCYNELHLIPDMGQEVGKLLNHSLKSLAQGTKIECSDCLLERLRKQSDSPEN